MTEPRPARLHIEIQKADGFEAFGAYEISPARTDPEKRVVLLNVYAELFCAAETGMDAKEIIVETLMHEFGHVIEEWIGLAFDEDRIERFTRSYAERYGETGYEDVHGDQSLMVDSAA